MQPFMSLNVKQLAGMLAFLAVLGCVSSSTSLGRAQPSRKSFDPSAFMNCEVRLTKETNLNFGSITLNSMDGSVLEAIRRSSANSLDFAGPFTSQ